jgi:hypothetical protein
VGANPSLAGSELCASHKEELQLQVVALMANPPSSAAAASFMANPPSSAAAASFSSTKRKQGMKVEFFIPVESHCVYSIPEE